MSAVLVLSDGLSNGRELIGGCGLYGRAWASRMVVHMCPCEEKRGGLGLGAVICVLVPGLADIRDRLGTGKDMDSRTDRLGRYCAYISVLNVPLSPSTWASGC